MSKKNKIFSIDMPYKMYKVRSKKCYRVINKKTKRVHAKCTSKRKATRQIRLMNALDHGFLKH